MNLIQYLLDERGISQNELSRAIGIPQTTITQGLKKPTHWQLVAFLSIFLGLSEEERQSVLAEAFEVFFAESPPQKQDDEEDPAQD